ncbi:hypothetical protein DFH07DRAFT_680194, partial [Mycena maculata]
LCPGRYMATSFVWIAVASILATFNIEKAVGADGNTIEPTYEYTWCNLPVPFECFVTPRSPEAAVLVQ